MWIWPQVPKMEVGLSSSSTCHNFWRSVGRSNDTNFGMSFGNILEGENGAMTLNVMAFGLMMLQIVIALWIGLEKQQTRVRMSFGNILKVKNGANTFNKMAFRIMNFLV